MKQLCISHGNLPFAETHKCTGPGNDTIFPAVFVRFPVNWWFLRILPKPMDWNMPPSFVPGIAGRCLKWLWSITATHWPLGPAFAKAQAHMAKSWGPQEFMAARRYRWLNDHGSWCRCGYFDVLHIFRWQFMLRYCWDQGDWGFFINPTYNPNVTRLVHLECKVISSFHILWLRANHFRVATENWSNSYFQGLLYGCFQK